MQNLRNTKLPSAGLVAGVVQAVVYGGGAAYGLYHSLFNVEGGHRAIVYNRITGVKEKVRPRPLAHDASSPSSPVSSVLRGDTAKLETRFVENIRCQGRGFEPLKTPKKQD